MSLTEIIKNQEYFKNLVQKRDENMLANAMLFFCEDEKTNDITLVLTALMLEYKMFDLFNEDSAEFLKIQNGVDLDVRSYPKSGERLVVTDSNEIVDETFVRPLNLPYKIFVINGIDSATEEAQNKLLKVLEEPPKNVYFLLSAKSEERVLPTIKSRCDKIKIPPLGVSEISKVTTDRFAMILGNGYLGKTVELAKKENLREIVNFGVELFTKLKSSKQVLSFSKVFLGFKDDVDLVLEVMSLVIEEILKIKCESESLCKLEMFKSDLKDVEPEFSVETLCEISKLILHLREKIEFNANLTVAIDNFLLKILEVKYICK